MGARTGIVAGIVDRWPRGRQRRRRNPRSLAVAALALATCLGFACRDAPPPPRPGRVPLVLIVLDALHAGHLSHLGYARPTTPELDAIAAEGMSFTQALAPAPYTLASIPSLLTGKLPDSHGLTRKTRVLDPAETTLAEILRGAGYRTFGAVANPNGSSLFGLDQGFETFVEVFRADGGAGVGADVGAMRLPRAGDFVPVLEDWLASLEGDEPFFFYLHLLEPHSPYTPPEPYRSRWIDTAYEGRFAGGDTDALVASNADGEPVAPADAEAARALYDANLAYADAVVGELVGRLRAAGRYEGSLLVVTSDHGEAFWQHGRWGHNDQLYEEMLRVPLIVKLPADGAGGSPWSGARVDGLASVIDVVPSLCDWMGLPEPKGIEGWSLTGLLGGGRGRFAERQLYLRTNADFPTLGLRTPTHKSILHRDPKRGTPAGTEHFDLERDPHERASLGEDEWPQAADREAAVQRWGRVQWETDRLRRTGRPELAAEAQELLRQLGYTD